VTPDQLRARYEEVAIRGLERTVPRDAPHYAANVEFVKQRFAEGLELIGYFASKYGERPLRILDLGAGAGGVSIALASEPWYRVVAVDVVMNPDLAELSGEPVAGLSGDQVADANPATRQPGNLATAVALTRNPKYVVASADALPFADGSFDAVLCLETIEHLPKPKPSAREMMRILKSAGLVMITTPARFRWLFKPDPHYQIRGLALLPDFLQKKFVENYDVEHLFWTAGGMIRMFPGRSRVETLVAIPWPGRPRNLKEILWKIFRRLLWDRIVIWKG
jgi:2-polyprenyl-3-methyl-5-hydroxy-6-metoxy-1,4-benzoquinol methylase